MSELEVTYDSMDAVPTEFASLYTERDGKAVLTGIKGIKTEADIRALKVVTDKERARARELETKLKKYERLGDADPEELLKMRDEIDELRARGAGGKDDVAVQKIVDAAIARATGPLTRDLATTKAERDAAAARAAELDGTIKAGTLRNALTSAALAAKVVPEAVDDVLARASLFEVGDDGKPVTRDGVGVTPGLSPSEWLTETLPSKPHWSPMSTGGGARGSGGGAATGVNPFKRETFNLAACGAIAGANPAQALQLAQRAGYASIAEAMAAAGKAAGR